jgi:malic enzyme
MVTLTAQLQYTTVMTADSEHLVSAFACLCEQALKPTAIIGTSGQHGAFTKEGLEELASYQDVRTVVRQISE